MEMVILLPRNPDELARWEADLTPETLERWHGVMSSKKVTVFLPRFRITNNLKLETALKSMGVADAFSKQADFSGMNGKHGSLYLSEILQKAFVKVDEEGTVAAAVTNDLFCTIGLDDEECVLFRADHPFVFWICTNAAQFPSSVLFIGRVIDPSAD